MKYLPLFFISFSLFAGYVAPNKSGFYKSKQLCEQAQGAKCLEIKYQKDLNTNDFDLADEMISDLKSPIHLKDKTITCNDKIDCDAKFLEQSTDYCPSDYKHIKNHDLLQIYCYKFGGYEQKLSGNKVLKFNQSKKDMRLKVKADKKKIKDEEDARKAVAFEALRQICATTEDPVYKNLCILLMK